MASLMIISFLLHIILLASIYYLFQQIQSLKQEHTKEVTDLFEMYLQEIKAENNRLENEIPLQKPSNKQEPVIEPTPIRMVRQENEAEAVEEIQYMPQTNTVNDHHETSLEAQILQLYHLGLSADDIAKKLNCGKTEAALVIKISGRKKS